MRPGLLFVSSSALGLAVIAAVWNAPSPSRSTAPRYAFRVGTVGQTTYRDLPASIVGSFSRDDIPGNLWPFRQAFVTVICAETRLAAVVGPRDALALNGWTSSFRSRGKVIEPHGDEIKLVGISSTHEARAASFVRSDVTTEELNKATDTLLAAAADVVNCK